MIKTRPLIRVLNVWIACPLDLSGSFVAKQRHDFSRVNSFFQFVARQFLCLAESYFSYLLFPRQQTPKTKH